MLKRASLNRIEITIPAFRMAHSPHASSRPHCSGQACIFSLLTPTFGVKALSTASVSPLSVFRITTLVVFRICLRDPRHPGTLFFGDLLELTLETCDVFGSVVTCCTLRRETSTVLWSLGFLLGLFDLKTTPTTMHVVFKYPL